MDLDPIELQVQADSRQFYLLDIDGSLEAVGQGLVTTVMSSTTLVWRQTSEETAIEFMSECLKIESEYSSALLPPEHRSPDQ